MAKTIKLMTFQILIVLLSFFSYAACDGTSNTVSITAYSPDGTGGYNTDSETALIGGAGLSANHDTAAGTLCNTVTDFTFSWSPQCKHYGQYYAVVGVSGTAIALHTGAAQTANVIFCTGDDCEDCCEETYAGKEQWNWTNSGGENNCCGDDGLNDDYCMADNKACYDGKVSTDDDANSFICTCTGGVWENNIEEGPERACCGTGYNDGVDTGDYRIFESDSPERDGTDSSACCAESDACVDDDKCYSVGSVLDLDEPEDSGAADTNDVEICGANHDWTEQDSSEDACTSQGNTWAQGGESGEDNGGYDSFGWDNVECCGDDDGEFVVYNDNNPPVCCDADKDFVAGSVCFNGDSSDPASVKSWIAGYIYGEDPENPGVFNLLNDANVTVRYKDYGEVNYALTDGSEGGIGFFNITIRDDVESDIHVIAPKYVIGVWGVTKETVSNYNLAPASGCASDCTSDAIPNQNNVRLCDKNCAGISGCEFDPSVNQDGDLVADICHAVMPGFTRTWNATHDVFCCGVENVANPPFTSNGAGAGAQMAMLSALTGVSDVVQSTVATVITDGSSSNPGSVYTVELVEFDVE